MFGLFKKQKDYLEWDEYKRKADALDDFLWRQKVREQSLKNL